MSERIAAHRRGALAGLVAAMFLSAVLAPLPSLAAVDQDTLKQRVAEEFDAEVLKVEEGTLDGQKVFYVTMMRQGGNDNAAFKVDTVAFHAETGEPLRGQIPERRGSENLPSMRTGLTEKQPDVLRGRAWR